MDPPRPEAIEAVAACRRAGVRVLMITGDHPRTAAAVAAALGLAGRPAVTGAELDALDDDALRALTRTTDVYARVTPEHKLRLVRALRAQGAVVAMTGDGVNDAPALRQADIGVAMGRGGTAAAKEAADMVLADDDFATLRAAVEEGRRVYDNLVKALSFVLPTSLGQASSSPSPSSPSPCRTAGPCSRSTRSRSCGSTSSSPSRSPSPSRSRRPSPISWTVPPGPPDIAARPSPPGPDARRQHHADRRRARALPPRA